MDSDKEEITEHLDEPNVNIDATAGPSEHQEGNGLAEHAIKPRRRKRSKKRKQRQQSAAVSEADNPATGESESQRAGTSEQYENRSVDSNNSPEWGSDDSCNYDAYSGVIIRPLDVPMAPLNSTQFIMDDHDDCRFYMSFETPNPYGVSISESDHDGQNAGDIIEFIGEDAAYRDIDYQYESPQDFDNSAYYDKEFELSYKNNRFEELMRLTRTDLIVRLQALEHRYKELSEDLVKENPSPILEKLQAELLELQEKNSHLKECNSKLTSVLQGEGEEADSSASTSRQLVTSESSIPELTAESSSIEHESADSGEEEVMELAEDCNNEVFVTDSEQEPEVLCDSNSNKNLNIQSDHESDNEPDSNQHFSSEDMVSYHSTTPNHDEDSSQCVDIDSSADTYNAQQADRPNSDSCEFSPGPKLGSSGGSGSPLSSEDIRSTLIQSSPQVMLYQPSSSSNNMENEDLRTLEFFHINQTTCSSSVPREGGMSPSETSVN